MNLKASIEKESATIQTSTASLAAMVKAEAISGGDVNKLTALLQSNDDDGVNAPAATVFENTAGSGNVIDSLNGLLDKANAQLEDARSTEVISDEPA